jgi:predicted DNA-binding transcriptional regulator YafY
MVEQQDGSVTLCFAASGEKEILAWLYSYLPHVQLLEPVELKAQFYNGLEQCLRMRDTTS